jgi:hypothetical protein
MTVWVPSLAFWRPRGVARSVLWCSHGAAQHLAQADAPRSVVGLCWHCGGAPLSFAVRHLAECGGKGLAVPRPCRRSRPRRNGERPCRCPWCGEEARTIRELEVRLAVVREVPRSSWLAGSPRINFGRTGNERAVTNLRWYGVVGEDGQVMAGGTQKHAAVGALATISPSRQIHYLLQSRWPGPSRLTGIGSSLRLSSRVERNARRGVAQPNWAAYAGVVEHTPQRLGLVVARARASLAPKGESRNRGLCKQMPNNRMNRTARELRSRVPVALRAPAAGYAERSASG